MTNHSILDRALRRFPGLLNVARHHWRDLDTPAPEPVRIAVDGAWGSVVEEWRRIMKVEVR